MAVKTAEPQEIHEDEINHMGSGDLPEDAK